MNRPIRTRNAVLVAAAAVVAAVASPALAGNEYVAASTTGLYEAPPTGATSQIGPGQDDATKDVALPFEFPFFGRLHTKVTVCTNGWLAFGATTANESANPALPSAAAPNGIVAALWDDLTTGTGSVKTFTSGSAPNRVFVVSWDSVDTFSGTTDAVLSFQVRLAEATGAIEVAYSPDGAWDGLSYTAGIDDPTGTVAFGAGSTANDRSGQPDLDWRFSPRSVPVTGRLLRDRPAATSSGLGPGTQNGLPVVGIDLELVREDTGEVAARGRPGEDGTFSLTPVGADAPATFALDLVASGEESRVVDGTGTVYRHRLATAIAANPAPALGTITLGASADAANPSIRKAVNLQQAARRAFAWARAAAAFSVEGTNPAVAAEVFPRLDLRFVLNTAATGGRTIYQPATPTAGAVVLVHDATDNPDAWDDDVILRDCAHHVFATISVYPGPPASRAWATATTPTSAFLDGFAHWFACVVQARTEFIDTRSATTATTFDLEAATPAPRASEDTTGAVACSLWELVDGTGEVWDEFAGTIAGEGSTAQQVFRTIDLDLDSATAGNTYDIGSFFDEWRASGPVEDRRTTARAFIHHGAIADDAREPNDRSGEESAAASAGRIDGLTLSPFNEDRFSFGFVPPEPTVVTATVTKSSTAAGSVEFDLEILDAGGAVIASATNAGAPATSRVSATTAAPVGAGTYTVRVAWRAGTADTYSVAFHAPLRLVGTPLPEWTAGLPYKVDLSGAGGVPPYTFATTASVPGLAVSNGGTRLSGTPTTGGEYVVRVNLTDSSGAGTSLAEDVPLTIHGALAMPEFVGLAAGRDAAVDVGTGGTSPQWAAGTSPGGGLVLTGGPTLRLTGTSGVARTFTVQGAAFDAVGDVLETTTSRVVVSELVPSRGSVAVGPGSHFGLWFDGLAGAKIDLRFRFSGVGERPELVALVDDGGSPVGLEGRVATSGRTVRLSGVRLPASSRYFAIFAQKGTPLVGTVSVAGSVASPAEFHGVVAIGSAEAVVDVPFDAIAASRLRILVRAEEIPRPVVPSVFGLRDPSGANVNLPPSRRLRGAKGVRIEGPTLGDLSGTYVLRIAGDGTRTGPVFWRIRVDAPSRAFALF